MCGSMNVPKTLIAASSVPLVLSVLCRGESYGYALIQQVRGLSRGEVEWTEGMLYPILHRLEREGLIEARWGEGDGERRRRYYRINSAGRAALATAQTQWTVVDATLRRAWEATACPSA